jgi:potassium-dependent mechanosensitive channel
MRRYVALLARVVSVSVLAWTFQVAAQDSSPPASATKDGPEAILPADIPLRADADERFAEDVVQRSRTPGATAKLEKRLETLGASVRDEGAHFKKDELRLLSIERLESLARHWNFYGKELEAWRRDLKQAMAPHTEDAADLARRRADWEATRAAAATSGMAPALDNRIANMLTRITLAEQAVSGPLEQQTRLSRRANAIEDAILAGQKAVAAAIAYNDGRLARIDSPPLWELWNDPRQSRDNAVRSVLAGLEAEKRFLDDYNAANAAYLQKLSVAALLLLPLLLWLSYRSRRVVSDDPEIQSATRVLRRPVSSWLVLAMVGIVLLEPDAPMLRHQAAFLLALVPVLRLLPPVVYQALGPWPYVATVLYLLLRLGFLFLANPFYYRLYLLGLTLLTTVLLAWILWRRRSAAGGALTQSRRLVRFLGVVAIVGLLVAAVANLLGNVSLAEMITSSVLVSGYVGLVLYAGVTVLASVLRLLLARRILSRFSIVTQHAGPLLHSFTRLLRLAALVAWIIVVMNQFRVYRPVRDGVVAVLTFELKLGQLSLTLGGVLLFFFSVWLAFWLAKTVRLILQDEVLPKMSLPRGVGSSISSLTYYALVIAGLFAALVAAGFEVSQLTIVVGALGLGIGLGLQNVVNNFVSGLILMFERPIQPGDVVEVGGVSGKVREIGMRATTLGTFEGADVVVPNGMLLSEKLINWTLSDMDRRIDVNVGVAYGSDPRKVLELLMDVTKSTDGIATTPEPTVLFVGFGANSLDFAIRAWTNNFGDWVKIRSELTVRVHDALMAAGIEIPFPQQTLHVRSVSAAAAAALAGRGQPPEPRPG